MVSISVICLTMNSCEMFDFGIESSSVVDRDTLVKKELYYNGPIDGEIELYETKEFTYNIKGKLIEVKKGQHTLSEI